MWQVFVLIYLCYEWFKALAEDIRLLIAKVNDLQKDVSTLQSKATDKTQLVEKEIEQLQKRLFKKDGKYNWYFVLVI